MIPYVLLIIIPLAFSFCALNHNYMPARLCLATQRNSFVRKNNIAIPIFFVLLLLMLCLRDETIGRDLPTYQKQFNAYRQQDLKDFNVFRLESLFRLICWGVGQITDNYQVLLIVLAVLSILPIAIEYGQYRSHPYLQIIVFVNMSTFVILFSALKQCLAISCAVIAYRFVKQKQPFWFLFVVIIALGFHHSAFMILFMYPLYYMRLKKNHLWFVVPILALMFVFNRPIFQIMTTVLSFFGEEYELSDTSTGAYTMLILFLAFAVYSYVVADESQMDDELFGLRNFLLMAVVLQCFAPIHTLAMRLNYYFILFIPMLMARLMDIPKPGMKRIAKLASVLIALYFTYDFLSKTYQSYITGVSALDTIPYKFFWMH